jgi:hypothetical protein
MTRATDSAQPLALTLAVIWLAGCTSFELEGDGSITPESVRGEETIHGTLYGFKWKEPDVQKCGDGQGIYRVEYYTNVFYVAASVISLGFYVPQTVAWWCQAPAPDADDDVLEPGDDWAEEPGSS